VKDPARIERRCRRLLAVYPRVFRSAHGDEILGVLMAGVEEGRWRPGPAAYADLIVSGVWMRLRPRVLGSPSTVLAAVRLMYVGAVVELGTLITILSTRGSLRSAVVERNPHYTTAQWHAELAGHIVPLEASAAIAVGVWLWLAWANGRGHRWARIAFAVFFCLTTFGLAGGVSRNAATYAPADLVAGVALWLVALATVALLFSRGSGRHYASRAR
jgi:hypothetical protein